MTERNALVAEVTKIIEEGFEKVEATFRGYDYEDDLINILPLLYTNNLQEIVDYYEKDKPETLAEFYKNIREKGLLAFKPKALQLKNGPSLVLRPGAYLSVFRDYRFQVSMTESGRGDAGGSSSNLHHQLHNTRAVEGSLRAMIAVGHIAQATFNYPEVRKMYVTEPKEFEWFVQLTQLHSDVGCRDFDIFDFKGLIGQTKELPEGVLQTLALESPNSKKRRGGIFAHIVWGMGFVALKKINSKTWDIVKFDVSEEFLEEVENEPGYFKAFWERITYVLCMHQNIYLGNMIYDETNGVVPIEEELWLAESVKSAGDLFTKLQAATELADLQQPERY